MKVELDCEYCGVIAEFSGDEKILHYAAEAAIEEHWTDAHPYPDIRYNWSEK